MLLDTSMIFNKNDSIQGVDMVQKLCRFTLSIVFLMCSSWAQADGLFDFQMKLAKKGNAEAEYKVGEMYETGFGVKKNMKEAQTWTKKAAAQGHETAGFKLLYWDIKKKGLKGDNKKKFADLKTKAADGHLQAMYYVGKMYAYGVGVKKNYDKSLDWLNKATFGGVLEAEREAVKVRELKQKGLENRRLAKEKRAKEESSKAAEAEKTQNAQKQQQQEAERKKATNEEAKRKQQAKNKAKAKAKAKAETERKKRAYLRIEKAKNSAQTAEDSSAIPSDSFVQENEPVDNKRLYSIQAGMFASRNNAESFIEKLAVEKFEAYISDFVSSSGAVKYNVRVGRFDERDKAREKLKEYQTFFSTPAYVVIGQ